jgi:hypothetical protein
VPHARRHDLASDHDLALLALHAQRAGALVTFYLAHNPPRADHAACAGLLARHGWEKTCASLQKKYGASPAAGAAAEYRAGGGGGGGGGGSGGSSAAQGGKRRRAAESDGDVAGPQKQRLRAGGASCRAEAEEAAAGESAARPVAAGRALPEGLLWLDQLAFHATQFLPVL